MQQLEKERFIFYFTSTTLLDVLFCAVWNNIGYRIWSSIHGSP